MHRALIRVHKSSPEVDDLNAAQANTPVASARCSETTSRTTVSVIVPVLNEAKHIGDTLDQLLDQELPGIDLEIFVVDGRSTDTTREIVAKYATRFPIVRLLDNPGRLSSFARRLAVERSKGEYVLVIDGHCQIPSRTYLSDLVDAFARTETDCLGRPQPLDITGATTLQRAIAAARNSRLGHHPASYIYSSDEVRVPAASVAVAYRREVFDRVGNFDPNFDACEDYELNHRIDQAGMTCYLIPKLVVRYMPRNSLAGLFKQLFRYGRGRVRLLRKHPDTLSLSSFAPAVFLTGAISGPLICTFVPVLWQCYSAIIALYLLTVFAVSVQIAVSQRSARLLPLLPLVFAAVHMGAACGVIWELAMGRRPAMQCAAAHLHCGEVVSF